MRVNTVKDSKMTTSDSREAGLDALRIVAALMVVLVHCQWEHIEHCESLGEYWSRNTQYFVKVVSFVGVPVFFAISGYFSHTFDTPARVWHMLKRLAVIYLAMGAGLALVNLPLWVVSEGAWPEWGRVYDEILCCRAMWYIRDMVVIIPMFYVLNRFAPSYRKWAGVLIIPTALLNYFVGNIWEGVATVTFVGVPSILIGVWIRTNRVKIGRYLPLKVSILTLAVGIALSFAEVALRINNGTIHDQVYLLGMPIAVFGLFMLGLNRSVKWPSAMIHLGRRYSAWVYALHPAAMVVVLYLSYKLFGSLHWTFPVLAFIIGICLPMVIVYLAQWLRRDH